MNQAGIGNGRGRDVAIKRNKTGGRRGSLGLSALP